MCAHHPTTTPSNREGFTLSPAAVLLLAADTFYCEQTDSAPEDRAQALRFVDRFIQAAQAGGFTQADVLRSRMARNENGPAIVDLALQAERAAGRPQLAQLFIDFGL